MGITNLRQKLPEPLRRRLLQVIDTVGLLFSLYVAWLAFGLVQFVLKTGQVSPTLGVPIGLIYMAPVVGFVLLALRYGLSLFGVIDRFTPQEATQ